MVSPDAERLAFLQMVADGVGGTRAGGEASRLALEAVTRYVAETIDAYYRADSADEEAFTQALSDAALHVHADLLERAGNDPDRRMATTLSLWIGVWPFVYFVQVGDSRYYILRDGELSQISRDQTVGQELVDSGVLDRSQAARLRWADVLSSSIGGSESTPVVTRIDHDWEYVHLLCSDGLTKHVSDDRIRERLATMTSARQAGEGLLQDALDDGGTDNITLIVGKATKKHGD
jgi:protein phosphatase